MLQVIFDYFPDTVRKMPVSERNPAHRPLPPGFCCEIFWNLLVFQFIEIGHVVIGNLPRSGGLRLQYKKKAYNSSS